MTTTIKLSGGDLGSDEMYVRCDLTQAASPVQVQYRTDGDAWDGTQYQCADARHRDSGLAEIGRKLAAAAVEMPYDDFDCEWEVVVVVPREEKITEAAEHIDAEHRDSSYVYYARETSEWWRVSEDDLVDLYDLMHHDDEEIRVSAYSHWCAGGPGELISESEAKES